MKTIIIFSLAVTLSMLVAVASADTNKNLWSGMAETKCIMDSALENTDTKSCIDFVARMSPEQAKQYVLTTTVASNK